MRKAEANVSAFFNIPKWAYELRDRGYLPEKVVIADPLSYCAGVVRADDGIEDMFKEYPEGFYLYHAPIHNDTKLKEWESRGAKLIHDLGGLRAIPEESPVYISAHGIGPDVWEVLRLKRTKGKDATCPLVEKTQREARDLVSRGYKVWVFGNENHDEMVGTLAIAPGNIFAVNPNISRREIRKLLKDFEGQKLGVGSQTTLNQRDISGKIAYIKKLRPDVELPKKEDICYASQNRQDAVVAAIAKAGVELMIIFGSDETKRQPSSNTIRLREVSSQNGAKRASVVEDVSEIKPDWFNDISIVGVSAGASADPKRVSEFLICMREVGLRRQQLQRITVAEEPQVFASVRDFDFSQAA